MVKHTQTICRQQPTNCLSVFDQFVGLALKGLRYSSFVVSDFYFQYYSDENIWDTVWWFTKTLLFCSFQIRCKVDNCIWFHNFQSWHHYQFFEVIILLSSNLVIQFSQILSNVVFKVFEKKFRCQEIPYFGFHGWDRV